MQILRRRKMNKNKLLVITFCLAVLSVIGAPTSMFADDWNQATKLTFSEPVEVPGVVLPAGTYWFQLADNDSERNIVQIWNADRTQLVTTILAIPDYRMQPSGKTVVNFEERAADSPEAIQAWFYPGNNYGEQFVYPKARATQLAQQNNQPVLAMRDEQPPEQLKQAPLTAVSPSGEEIEMTEVVASEQVTPEPAQASALPQTASPIPLMALLGALILASGVGLRVARQMV
jgi:hypothetical protein